MTVNQATQNGGSSLLAHSVQNRQGTRGNEHLTVKTKMKKALEFQGLSLFGGLYWTRTSDPIDVNDVLWTAGQVVKLKYGREHT